jgi:hypothetical protein
MENTNSVDKSVLVNNVKEWIEIDNELKELQKAAKERRQRKKELTEQLVNVMKTNEIDCFDINGGKLIYSKNKVRTALSKKHLLKALTMFYKNDPLQVTEVTNFILNSRDEKIRETIRRKQ